MDYSIFAGKWTSPPVNKNLNEASGFKTNIISRPWHKLGYSGYAIGQITVNVGLLKRPKLSDRGGGSSAFYCTLKLSIVSISSSPMNRFRNSGCEEALSTTVELRKPHFRLHPLAGPWGSPGGTLWSDRQQNARRSVRGRSPSLYKISAKSVQQFWRDASQTDRQTDR